MSRRWKRLQGVSKELKARLKTHSGEKIELGSPLERDLKLYTKLKKLADRIKAGKDATSRINEYYAQLIPIEKPQVEDPKPEPEPEEEQEEEEDEIIIGPTPQLQGRIVNLLSIEISPEGKQDPQRVFETPSKVPVVDEKIMETPACFKRKLQFDADIPQREFNFDPSPIFKGNGRSIFSLNTEVKSLKRNLSQLLEEEKSLLPQPPSPSNDLVDEAEPEEITQQQDLNAFKIKAKTIKRSTRRVKMKTQKDIHEDDTFEEKQIHDFITNNSDDDENVSDGLDEDNASGEEETYERMDFTHLIDQKKKSGKHPLSNNFVRMKIHKRGNGNGRFKRR